MSSFASNRYQTHQRVQVNCFRHDGLMMVATFTILPRVGETVEFGIEMNPLHDIDKKTWEYFRGRVFKVESVKHETYPDYGINLQLVYL